MSYFLQKYGKVVPFHEAENWPLELWRDSPELIQLGTSQDADAVIELITEDLLNLDNLTVPQTRRIAEALVAWGGLGRDDIRIVANNSPRWLQAICRTPAERLGAQIGHTREYFIYAHPRKLI
jgi:hypothetical protein